MALTCSEGAIHLPDVHDERQCSDQRRDDADVERTLHESQCAVVPHLLVRSDDGGLRSDLGRAVVACIGQKHSESEEGGGSGGVDGAVHDLPFSGLAGG